MVMSAAARLFAASALHCIMQQNVPFHRCWGWECTAHFSSPTTLTFDLDIQSRPSEGANTSSQWIWRISVRRIIWFTNKKVTDSAKNRTLRSLLRAVTISTEDTLPRSEMPQQNAHNRPHDHMICHSTWREMCYYIKIHKLQVSK